MYRDLGGFPVTAVADPTGRNPFGAGYSTVILNADTTFRTSMPLVEVYHLWVNSQVGSAFQIWKNLLQYDNVLIGNNAWDPAQAMTLRSGDTLYFYFNQPFQTPNATNSNNPNIVAYLREPLDLWPGLIQGRRG
jgi:hypothetical protein